jgi:dihydrofolate reductase
MKKPIISIICAIAENRAIGKNNQLLWRIPEDFKHFKDMTTGHVILMGQKTYESIGKLLPNRTTIIITNDKSFQAPGAVMCYSIEEAVNKAKELEKEEAFVCGGGSIYAQMMKYADKLHLTIVEGNFEADTFFPEYDQFNKIVKEENFDNGKYKFKFLELEKE